MATQQTIRIERGDPDEVEVAALLVALAVVLAPRPVRPSPRPAGWCTPARGALRRVTRRSTPRHVRSVAHSSVRPRSAPRTRTTLAPTGVAA